MLPLYQKKTLDIIMDLQKKKDSYFNLISSLKSCYHKIPYNSTPNQSHVRMIRVAFSLGIMLIYNFWKLNIFLIFYTIIKILQNVQVIKRYYSSIF